MLTPIVLSPEETSTRDPRPETVTRAATALRTHGCVLLRDLVSPAEIDTLREAFFARNPALRQAQRPLLAGDVGNRRFQSPLDLSGPFASADFFANPVVLPILRAVVGEEMILGACGAVTSLPGAKDQHIHRDCPPLFNKVINRLAPAHAVNFFLPLVEFNDLTGSTRLFPGTHLDTDTEPANAAFVDPVIPIGSGLLMDGRLYHQGRANRSEQIRPLLYCVYQQPWFKDYKNHATVPFLRLSDADYATMCGEHRKLVAWTEHYRTGLY